MNIQRESSLTSTGFKQARRVAVFVIGMSVLVFGLVLLVLPGPAVVVIPTGLAILGLEFRWARRWMRRAKTIVKGTGGGLRHGKSPLQLWREWRMRRASRRLRQTLNLLGRNANPATPDKFVPVPRPRSIESALS